MKQIKEANNDILLAVTVPEKEQDEVYTYLIPAPNSQSTYISVPVFLCSI